MSCEHVSLQLKPKTSEMKY